MKRNKNLVMLVVAIGFGLTLMLVPISSQVSPVQAAITWSKYSLNPVLEEGDPGDWDVAGVGAACVILDGNTYKMWFTGVSAGPGLAIGYATSSNAASWTKDTTNNPVLTGSLGEWDEDGVGSCCVIKESDTSYKIWYTGCKDYTAAIGYATSSDGIVWTKSASNPVLEGSLGEWDEDGVLSPCVTKESDTSYKLWYTGRTDDTLDTVGSIQIGYATSSDGINWVKSGSNPVLVKGSPSDWDSRGVGVGNVVMIDNTYHMWYTGYEGAGTSDIELAIGHATSSDGMSWANRSRELTEGTAWETNGVGAPWVIYSDSIYRMWYSGLDTNFDPNLGYAWHTVSEPSRPSRPSAPSPPLCSDISDYLDEYGVFIEDITAESTDGNCWVTVSKDTTGLTKDGMPLSEICIIPMEEPPPLPDFANFIGLVYDFRPDGATFDPPITLCITYDPALAPEGVAEENLVAAMWDEMAGEWANLNSTVYPATNTICAPVSHFTPFTILAYTRPASFVTSDLTIAPEVLEIGGTVTISMLVTNTGNLTDSYGVSLKIDNVVAATEEVTLAGGASQTVTFTVAEDAAGTYTISIDGLAGSFVVKAVPAPPPTPTPSPPPTPVPSPAEPVNWWLIGGIIAAGTTIIGVVVWLAVIRRRAGGTAEPPN